MKILFLFISVFLIGCAHRLIDFTIISSKNINLSNVSNFKRSKYRVEGLDSVHIIIFIPTGLMPNAKEALDKAIEKTPGAVALLDGVITRKWFYIPLIYGRDWYIVEGTALIDPNIISLKIKDDNYIATFIDINGEIQKTEILNKDKYQIIKNYCK